MKNRILSFVLAIVMVLAMVPVVAIGASAENGMGIELTLSNYTVTSGGIAYVDVYASFDDMAEYDGLCNYEIYFDLPEGVSILEEGYTFYYEGAGQYGVQGTVNVGAAMICCTADADQYIATADQLTAPGGALIVTVAFKVPEAEDNTKYEIGIANVTEMDLRIDGAIDDFNAPADDLAAAVAAATSGVVTVGTATVETPASADGVVCFPASMTALSSNDESLDAYTSASTYIVKNTMLADGSFFAGRKALVKYEGDFTVYCHKRANGADTTFDTISATGATVKNILSAGAIVDEETVTFYGNIVVADDLYEDVYLVAKFTYVDEETGETDVRLFTSKATTKVYTTLTNGGADAIVVSTNEQMAKDAGAEYAEGAYLFGAVVNGVKVTNYTLEVTAYGRTWDANGNLIYVCSDVCTQVVGA